LVSAIASRMSGLVDDIGAIVTLAVGTSTGVNGVGATLAGETTATETILASLHSQDVDLLPFILCAWTSRS